MVEHIPTIYEKITAIACELAAPKDKVSQAFGKYKYRDLPSIRNAVKPLLKKHGMSYIPSSHKNKVDGVDEVTFTAKLVSHEDGSSLDYTITVNGDPHKGMSAEQASGAALTYAEKYLLCQIFMIDDDSDSVDPDSDAVRTADDNAAKNAFNQILADIKSATTNEQINEIMFAHRELFTNAEFVTAVKTRRAEIEPSN